MSRYCEELYANESEYPHKIEYLGKHSLLTEEEIENLNVFYLRNWVCN